MARDDNHLDQRKSISATGPVIADPYALPRRRDEIDPEREERIAAHAARIAAEEKRRMDADPFFAVEREKAARQKESLKASQTQGASQ